MDWRDPAPKADKKAGEVNEVLVWCQWRELTDRGRDQGSRLRRLARSWQRPEEAKQKLCRSVGNTPID